MIRRLALAIALTTLFAVGSEAQTPRPDTNRNSTDSRIEVKDDRFTGKRTVRMLPVRVAPNIEMSLTGEVNTARKPDYMEMDLGVSVTAEFATPYKGGAGFEREMDFGFLIDGERTTLRTPPAKVVFDPYADRETGKQTAITVLMQSTLERVASARRVEMKLGETEVMLDDAVLKSIRAFVAKLQR